MVGDIVSPKSTTQYILRIRLTGTKLSKQTLTQSLNARAVVGLPSGQMGNSEVGHMHLGSGRLILQDLSRINTCISRDDLSSIEPLSKELETVAKHRSTLHLIGLLSPGGVHSHIDHLEALIKLSLKRNIDRILIHGFLDGRDTAPTSASESIEKIESICRQNSQVEIASLVGRYYGMDRNKNWDRTKIAHDLIASRKSKFRIIICNRCDKKRLF